MPEGDTILRAARSLHRALAGHVVTRFDSVYAHLSGVDANTPLAGRTVERCEAAGKHLLITFSGDLILRTHMRMNGSWHIYRHGERWWRGPQAMRIRLETAEWVAVAFDVPVAEFLTSRQLAIDGAIAALGPDLLSPAFDRDEASRRLQALGATPLSEALLNQRAVAGLGNVYKSEVLFLCGLNPHTPVGSLAPGAVARLLDVAADTMQRNIREARRRTTGRMAPGEELWVYGREGRPCRACGSPIRMEKTGEHARTTFWCEVCQR